jgi:hypothetical protein
VSFAHLIVPSIAYLWHRRELGILKKNMFKYAYKHTLKAGVS